MSKKYKHVPVAYAVFADNGNIRIWSADPIQAGILRLEYGDQVRPLYTAPQPAEQQPRTHWSHDNPGLADQYRAEALAARRSLGFEQDADDVAPADISAAIESLTLTAQDVEALVQTLYLALEYWRDRQQRYKNRQPKWVVAAESALAAFRQQGGES